MFLTVFVCLLHICNGQGAEKTEYVMNFDSPIYAFGDESQKFVDTSKIEVERYNESTAFMHGEIGFLQGLPENISLGLSMQKEISGKYEVVFNHDMANFCAELDEEGAYWKYLKYFVIPSECPIDAGGYKIDDFCLEMDDVELSSQHVGRYQLVLSFYIKSGESQQDKELKCMLKMDMIVEPK